MLRARLTATAVLLFGLALTSVRAAAEEPNDRADALAAVRDGNRLLDLGEPAKALQQFRHAFALVKSPKLHFNFGQALADIPGREREAYEEFQNFLDEVSGGDAETRSEANRQLAALRGRLAFVLIRANSTGVSVSIDGESRGATPLPRPLAVAPGQHELSLTKAGASPISETLELVVAQETVRDYVLRDVPPSPLGVPVPGAPNFVAAKRDGGHEDNRGFRIAGLAIAGTGVVLGASGFFVYRAGVDKLNHLDSSDQVSDSDLNYKTLGNTGIGLMIAAGALVGTGALLYWFNHGKAPETEVSGGTRVSLGWAPGRELHVGIAVHLW